MTKTPVDAAEDWHHNNMHDDPPYCSCWCCCDRCDPDVVGEVHANPHWHEATLELVRIAEIGR